MKPHLRTAKASLSRVPAVNELPRTLDAVTRDTFLDASDVGALEEPGVMAPSDGSRNPTHDRLKESKMLMLRRSLLSVLAGAAVLTAVATGPATASSSAPARPSLVHQTPKVPVIVDGVRYAPKQIHRFDGRPLYTRTAKNGKALIAYTKLADFRSYLRKQGLRLPTPTNLTPRKAKAKASRAGHHLKVCVDNFLMGDCYSIPSGWGIANFDSIADCDWFGHCWQFANTISSVHAVGQNAVLFDLPDFNPGGLGIHVVAANRQDDLAAVSRLNNAVESAFMFW